MDLQKLASIFEAVRVAELRPTDLLVFKTEGTKVLTLDEKATLHQTLVELTGHPAVVILDGGAELAILRTEPHVEPPAPDPDTYRHNSQGRPLPAKTGTAPGAIA
jgi:hypothetical protein